MNISKPVQKQIKQVSFSFYSSQQISELSVLKITNPVIFDTLDHPTANGLYDPRLGPVGRDTTCKTCFLDSVSCPGHFGHIELALCVFNPTNFKLLYKLLQSTCLYCHHLRTSRSVVYLYVAKLKLLYHGLVAQAAQLDQVCQTRPSIDDAKDQEEKETEIQSHSLMEEYYTTIDTYVKKCLDLVPSRAKITMVTDAIRKLERQFLNAIPSMSCQNCKGQSPKYRKDGLKIFEKPLAQKVKGLMNARGLVRKALFSIEGSNAESSSNTASDKDTFVSPLSVKRHMELLWSNENQILDLFYGVSKANRRVSDHNMFFLENIAVTPTRFRPVSKMNDMQFEHPQNVHLADILKTNAFIHDLVAQETDAISHLTDAKEIGAKKLEFFKKTVDAWIRLQSSVEYLIDSSNSPLGAGGKMAPPGVRQLLEKKEGLFRKHMMGKRVNYACRSVISPDPYIETNEIGIPPVFAVKLTYPEPVTPHNVTEMRACVVNGPEVWPGATHIQNEDGSLTSLASFDHAGRTTLANQLLTPTVASVQENNANKNQDINKKVYRHLRNGDFLLLNRQPTLHKPSIMAHTARVLPGEKTIRMHYANCNTYNADFDGDEMNCHFPQNEIARAEAMLIARNDLQYLVPTDGAVLRGLIQDHVDAGVGMCSRDSFFHREDYIQLVFAGLRESNVHNSPGNGNIEHQIPLGRNGAIITMPPAVIKPKQMWTGKQIISTIMYNLTPSDRDQLNLQSKSKIPAAQWGPSAPEEQTVVFMDGQLVTGILDKSQFGASANGLVHAVHEIYGPQYAGKLLSILGRLFTAYLQIVGFTCRMDDLLLNEQGDLKRRALISAANQIGPEAVTEYTEKKSDKAIHLELEQVLRDTERMAGLDSAMKTRTNKTTSEIISTCIPAQLFKPFPHNNMQVMTVSGAKGSSVNVSQISCLLGQQELEGKRVPTMVSGKTLPSFRAFDTSARSGGYITGRFLTGIRPQEYYFHCMAGREGLIDTAVKTSRSGYLQRCLIKHLEGLRVHYDHTVRDVDGSVVQFFYGEDGLDILKQTTLKKFEFNAMNYRSLLIRHDPAKLADKLDEDSVYKFVKKHKKRKEAHDPVMSIFSPSRHVGSVSDGFKQSLDEYVTKSSIIMPRKPTDKDMDQRSPWPGSRIPAENFTTLMNLKYMQALVEPGEAVGLLAAQSIGEPSTQMTLNTFHFAGFGAKNVTLGIPRLREIIMTASSNLKTPLMKLPVKDGIQSAQVKSLCDRLSKLVLGQIMTGAKVIETFSPKGADTLHQISMEIFLDFWDPADYNSHYDISSKALAELLETSFVPALERAINRDIKGRVRKDAEEEGMVGKSLGSFGQAEAAAQQPADDEAAATVDVQPESDADSDTEGHDTLDDKERQKKTQMVSYDDDGEQEDLYVDEPSDNDDESSPIIISEEDAERKTRILARAKYMYDFKFNGKTCIVKVGFPADTKKILMLALVETVCNQVVINQIPAILRAYVFPNESENDKSVSLGTDGCNLKGMWDFGDILDVNKISTNDIAAILKTYGVEAARAAIMQEIAGVFAVYGIDVDSRHLSLIADYMVGLF